MTIKWRTILKSNSESENMIKGNFERKNIEAQFYYLFNAMVVTKYFDARSR